MRSARPGLCCRRRQFLSDGKNPTFASLNSKTITIDDWEFSPMSGLCHPNFDEKKAKSNGHICILVRTWQRTVFTAVQAAAPAYPKRRARKERRGGTRLVVDNS